MVENLYLYILSNVRFVLISDFYVPLYKGSIFFATVGLSVCRPSVIRSSSFDSFTWSIPNMVQGLLSISRWSVLIFRSHVQRSRSNHSSKPTGLSAQYLVTPSLDQYQTCPQWVDAPYVTKHCKMTMFFNCCVWIQRGFCFLKGIVKLQ